MRMKLWIWLTVLFVGCGVASSACSLPAEPMAAALPMTSDPNVKMVMTGPASWYYLVPEGTVVSLKIVWDPYDHNSPSPKPDKWDWCAKKGVVGASGIMQPNPTTVSYDAHSGPRFYDLNAMASFFSSLSAMGDAVGDEFGATPSNQMKDAGIFSPSYLLKAAFVKPGNNSNATINSGDRVPGYPSTSSICSPSCNDEPIETLDSEVPNDSGAFTQFTAGPTVDTSASPQTKTTYSYVPLSAKLYLGDVKIDAQCPPLENYKAYILEGGPNVWADSDGLPSGPAGFTGGLGNPSGIISTSFWVPTLGATSDVIKVKVNCPSAGFVIKNMGWAWEEKVIIHTASSTDIDGDGALNDFVPGQNISETVKKCSVGLQCFVFKGTKGAGHTAYKVYDNRPPVASTFKITTPPTITKGQKMGQFGFEMKMADSNPFGDKPVTVSAPSFSFKHDINDVKNSIKIYYSYPVYEYVEKSGLAEGDLCTANAGLLDESSSGAATWKGLRYKPYWVWKEATGVNVSTSFEQKTDGSGKLVGGVWTLTGTANFDQPVPWHFSTDMAAYSDPDGAEHPSENTDDPKKLIKIFAIGMDSAGKRCVFYDSVAELSDANKQKETTRLADVDVPEAFDPAAGSPNSSQPLVQDYNNKPPLSGVVSGGDWAGAGSGPSGAGYKWQKFAYVDSVPDQIKPEIEVFIFDQRKNKYHTFGTKAGGWAKYTDLAPKFDKDYASLSPIPYSDESQLTTGMQFTTPNDGLFDAFFNTNKSLVNADMCSQFICQQNTRLTFFVRAWDNINTFQADKGIDTLTYALVDAATPNTDPRPGGSWTPGAVVDPLPYWTFRAANSGGEECSFTVNAKDKAGNTQTLRINFKILAEDLNVRSLEEQRYRKNAP